MILVPLPAVVATLLGMLLCLVALRQERRFHAISVFLAVSTALMIVVSLRWSLDAPILRFLQPVVAALLPPAAWLCFSGLRGGRRRPVWPHFLPVALVFFLSLLWPRFPTPIDALLAGLFLGYGCALIWRGMGSEEGFAAARLGEPVRPGRVAILVGILLLLSGAVDLAIAFDVGLSRGAHIGLIVSLGNMLTLPLIAGAALVVARSLPETEDPPQEEAETTPDTRDVPTADDAHVLAEVHRILRERHLYRDPDLTLERLARRVGIPARHISQAINRKLGRNVSQEINRWRIREAQTLLEQTDRAVTAIMFDCGFQTKSNFNATFRRLTGLSPSDWRRRATNDLSAGASSDLETP